MKSIFFKTSLFLFCVTCFIAGSSFAQSIEGNIAAGATLYERCVPCHGLNGKNIAGMKIDKIIAAINMFKEKTYTEPLKMGMQKAVKDLTPEQMLDIATYVNKMKD